MVLENYRFTSVGVIELLICLSHKILTTEMVKNYCFEANSFFFYFPHFKAAFYETLKLILQTDQIVQKLNNSSSVLPVEAFTLDSQLDLK